MQCAELPGLSIATRTHECYSIPCLADADSDAEVSHDDSMSGSREHAQHAQHAAADRPLLSTRPCDRLLAV